MFSIYNKKIMIAVIKAAIGILILSLLVYSVNFSEVFQLFRQTRKEWLLLCILVNLVVFDFQALLLGLVAQPFARIPHSKLLAMTMLGRFFSQILPSSVGGDLVKGIYLFPYFSSPSKVYAAIIIQRFLGGLATLTVFMTSTMLVAPQYASKIGLNKTILPVALAVVSTIALVAVCLTKMSLRKDNGNRRFYPIRAGVAAISAYKKHYKLLFAVYVLSMLMSVAGAVIYVIGSYALQIRLNFPQALVASSAGMLAILIPLTPGGVGIGEGTFVFAAKAMGIPMEHALALALLVRVLSYISSMPGAVIYFMMPMRRVQKE